MTPRARALKRAIEDKLIPKCRVAGCCFRSRVCPVHDLEQEPNRGFESMVRSKPHGGGRR